MAAGNMHAMSTAHQGHSASCLVDSLKQLLSQMLRGNVFSSIHGVQEPIPQESQLIELVDELYDVPFVETNLLQRIGKQS